MVRFLSVMVACALLGAGPRPLPDFRYDAHAPSALRTTHTVQRGNIEIRDIAFAAGERRIGASLVRPFDRRRHAGILFVHWLGDPQTTNRSEFLAEACVLARHGATSLLVDAMWAQPDWFDRRTTSGDYAASIEQVIALRRSLDVLTAQPDVDPKRIAYVGHDFGAMYGALVAGVDSRPAVYVFMTPTVTFWEWYLLGARPADKYAYIEKMRALDTVNYLPHARMRATLVQFGEHDEYVPAAAAREFSDAVPDREKTVKTYNAGHDLNLDAARNDRRGWLISHLALK